VLYDPTIALRESRRQAGRLSRHSTAARTNSLLADFIRPAGLITSANCIKKEWGW
jgi:hypothetical protein